MTIKLIALDLDGTTLNKEGKLSPKTREAFEKAIDRGVNIVIATGRCFDALPAELIEFPGLQYAITSNGAQIRDMKTGDTLYSNCIDDHAIGAIADTLEDHDHMMEVFVDGRAYIEKKWYEDVMNGNTIHRSKNYVLRTRRPTEGLMSFMRNNALCIENINIFFDTMEDKAAMWEVLVKLEDVTLTSSFDNNWEIGGATTSKGAAVEALCEELDIHKDHVMACGDSPNDAEMLKIAGVPVAVGNAKDVIKELAIFVSGTNEEDGVATAIEKFVLKEVD